MTDINEDKYYIDEPDDELYIIPKEADEEQDYLYCPTCQKTLLCVALSIVHRYCCQVCKTVFSVGDSNAAFLISTGINRGEKLI